MCGICGHTKDGRGDAVREMNSCMIARGPDDEGSYVDSAAGVALGARRLSILDVEGGHQPLSNEDGTVWAVLNGEIYNYPALRQRLLARGHALATRIDTEVLVHLYEDFGVELVHALEGMFAFAVWDSRRRRLLLARDRFGEKPLFYTEFGGALAFASELTALRAGVGMHAELDPQAVDDFFVLGYVPGPGSIVRGVSQLPPGNRLQWNGKHHSEIDAYWRPPDRRSGAAPPDRDELVDELERLLDDSVRRRMLADVPLGVFLSGGTDSVLVASLAARHSPGPVKTFTVDYDVGEVGEGMAAREAAAAIDAEHHELILTQAEIAAKVPDLLSGLDQPLADQALVALHSVAGFARPQVKVALGGEGADELFGGYPRYRWLERSELLHRHTPDAAAHSIARLVGCLPDSQSTRRLTTLISPMTMIERHLDWVTFERRGLRQSIYGSRLRDLAGNPSGVEQGAGELSAGAAGLIDLDLAYWLADDVLAKADRATMRSSLEMRTPFLERELAELACSIPVASHLRGGGKHLLREVLKRVVPNAVRRRPKRAFRVPAREWLRGPLAPLLHDQLQTGSLFEEGWFDRGAVAQLHHEHTSGSADYTEVLWTLLALGLWLDGVRGGDGG